MRTITYTYDETKPTNKDYLIAVLTDSIDEAIKEHEERQAGTCENWRGK